MPENRVRKCRNGLVKRTKSPYARRAERLSADRGGIRNFSFYPRSQFPSTERDCEIFSRGYIEQGYMGRSIWKLSAYSAAGDEWSRGFELLYVIDFRSESFYSPGVDGKVPSTMCYASSRYLA